MTRGLFVCVIFVAACGGDRGGERMRSPTLDYPPPPTRTASDGEVLGADEQRPEDRLEQGPRIGPGGPQGAEEHPFAREESEDHRESPPPQPCQEIGARDASGRPRCPETQKMPPAGE